MLIHFSAGGRQNWTVEIDSMRDHLLLDEFKQEVEDLADHHLEVQWVGPQYNGRILDGLAIVGRFWREEASEVVGAGA